jgi:hypothetical protein
MKLIGRAVKCAGVCASLGLVTWLSLSSHRPRRIPETSVVTIDGVRLSSVFEGLRRDPQYDLRNIPVHNATVIRCPAQVRTWLDKVKALLVPSAYASGNCPNTPCAGQNYETRTLTCSSSSGCQGSFGSAVYNPNAPLENGVHEDGTFGCTSTPGNSCTQGLCNFVVCTVPTCTACTRDNEEPCDVGELCTNGCCGKQQCVVGAIPPHNLACQVASDCESGYCNSGCCANCEPGTNAGCTGGDVCTNGDCVPPPPPCKSQGVTCTSSPQCCSNNCSGQPTVCLPAGSPIVLDAFEEGYHLTSLNNGVQFRVLPGGPLQQMSWTNANWRNGWLALDRNGDGTIDDFTELFGNYTAQPPSNTPNGFLALAVFDNPANGGNGNGFIDPGDTVYSHLWVWIDSNHNGISEPNELHTLQELGIFKIGLKYHSTPFVDQYGNQFRFKGSFWDESDNEKDLCYDVFLQIQAQ